MGGTTTDRVPKCIDIISEKVSINSDRLKVKALELALAIVLLTRVRVKKSSAFQYLKWQLIGMS